MSKTVKDIIVTCIYDDDTGMMISMTGINNPREIIYCKDCKYWDREDGTFKDFDGKEWHSCKELDAYTAASGEVPVTPSWFYCGYGERKEE